MLTPTCSSCHKELAVEPELAGKQIKCPGCGKVTLVPGSALASASHAERMTLPPEPLPEPPTCAAPTLEGEQPTISPVVMSGATGGGGSPAANVDISSLTDFLAPSQAEDELGRLGKYRILKILGHGGMGVVFLGEDSTLGRKVAIKAMLPHLAQRRSSQQRFLREAKAAAALEHDNIVPIFNVDEDRGAPFIVMPLLKGQSLAERLKSGAPLALADVLHIARETAQGLDAAHRAGLIHRDIKPANIWLEASPGRPAGDSRVKILDFGLARLSSDDSGLTQEGTIIGTPAYMAPEQGNAGAVDARTDLFSFGVVLYRLCTGKLPFHGKDTVSTIVAVATTVPAAPASINHELPPELSELVMKLLGKDRNSRIASAAMVIEVIQALETKLAAKQLAEDKTETVNVAPSGVSGQVTPPSPVRSRALRPVALIVLGLAAVCALVAGTIIYLQTDNGTVRIEINDPKIKVAVAGEEITFAGADTKEIRLKPGKHGISITRDDFTFDTTTFELKRGETITLKIDWFPEGKLQVVQGDRVIGAKITGAKGGPQPPPPTPAATGGRFALHFNGKDSGVEVPSLRYDGSHPITIEAWARADSFPKQPDSKQIAGWNGVFELSVFATGLWALGFEPGPDPKKNPRTVAADGPLSTKDWQRLRHVAGVWDGKIVRVFVDGRQESEKALAAIRNPNSPGLLVDHFAIGCQILIGFGRKRAREGFFDGIITEIRISRVARYDRDFLPAKRFESDADTLALYHGDEGSGNLLKDSSGNGHHGKIVGAKWVKADGTPLALELPVVVSEAKKLQDAAAAQLQVPVETITNIGMRLRLIPPTPALPKAFYIGKYEVTQAQWQAVMGCNPSEFSAAGKAKASAKGLDTSQFPVDSVSWFDAIEFCNKLSVREGLKPYFALTVTKRTADDKQIETGEVKILGGPGYRLPRKSEWSHACMAGAKTPYHFGDKAQDLPAYDWCKENSGGRPHAVGALRSNGFGLFDMHGNVREWQEEPVANNDTGALEAGVRCGCWYLPATIGMITANRLHPLGTRDFGVGLRVAQDVGSGRPFSLADFLTSPDFEWSAPENLGLGVNTMAGEHVFGLTDDELLLLLRRDALVMISRRASKDAPFAKPEPLPDPINRLFEHGAISGDGLVLVFSSKPEESKNAHLWLSERKSLEEPFGTPVLMPEPINSKYKEIAPLLSADGLTLLFGSARHPGGMLDVFLARRDSRNQPFGEPSRLPAPINTPEWDEPVWISNDGRVLLTRWTSQGMWKVLLFIKTTADGPFVEKPWTSPWPIKGSNTATKVHLSADGERIYFNAGGITGSLGSTDIYVSRRAPKKKGD